MKRSQLIGGAFHYSRWPLSHFLDEMNKLGIGAIEFYAASPHLYPDDYTSGMAKTIRRQIDDAGIETKVITAEQCLLPISICASDPVARERSLRMYEKNQIPYDYAVEMRNRFKGLDLIDRVPDELWNEVRDTVQETGIKTIPKKNATKQNGCLGRPYK